MSPTRVAAQVGFIGVTILLVVSALMGEWGALAIAVPYLSMWLLGFGVREEGAKRD